MATGKRTFFYKSISVNVAAFPDEAQIKLPFRANHVIIVNKNKQETLTFSFQRPDVDGELDHLDGPIALDGVSVDKFWFKAPTGKTISLRVWAWRL